jgi:uncharacterized membrane protein
MEYSPGATPPQSSGMDPKLAGLLAYVIPPITGIIFFLIEKSNQVVRWHAAQSIVFGVAWIVLWIALTVLSMVLSAILPLIGTIIGFLITFVVFIGGVILWIICLIKGYSGTMWRMPLIAQFADKIMGTGPATR